MHLTLPRLTGGSTHRCPLPFEGTNECDVYVSTFLFPYPLFRLLSSIRLALSPPALPAPVPSRSFQYLQKSKDLGDSLIVIVNSDKQASMKKGRAFMPAAERVKLVRALECVDAAVIAVDDDRTVCKTLSLLHPNIFTNGGKMGCL